MYRSIVVPLDGSPFAERALPYATALSRVSGARLVLLTSPAAGPIDLPDFRAPDPWSAEPLVDHSDTTGLAEQYLERIRRHLDERGAPAAIHVDWRQPAEAILRCVTEHEADLVIMATHGRSGVGRLVFGSVADAVMRASHVPVVMVPPHDMVTWSSQTGPSGEELLHPFRVLVPLDGSDLALAALEPARRLAGAFGGDIALLRVAEPPHAPHLIDEGDAFYDPAADLVHGRQYLQDVARSLSPLRVMILCDAGSTAEVIEDVAREWGVTAVCMATHGRSGLSRLVMGSVATAALRRAARPYLLIRPAAAHPHGDGVKIPSLAAAH